MRCKLVYALLILSTVLILLKVDAFSKSCSIGNMKTSTHDFITQYYKILIGGSNKSIIRQYHLETIDKTTSDILERGGWPYSHLPRNDEYFEGIIDEWVKKETEKFEIQAIKIISKNPMIIGVDIKEWNKSKDFSMPPFGEKIILLKDIGECNWKIIDVMSPYMP